jgi:uncharacterized protein (DUF1697 family)
MQYVAFLRAINVGGRAVVKMTDIQAAFTTAGCANVTTFIASGNVLFDAETVDDVLRARIGRTVGRLLGAEPVIVYRTMRELQRLVTAAPFADLVDDATLKLYVAFVAEKTKLEPRFPMQLPKEALEAIGLKNGDVLIVSRRKPNGMYGFPNNWIEKELAVVATARNWSTVRKIVELPAARTAPKTRIAPAVQKQRAGGSRPRTSNPGAANPEPNLNTNGAPRTRKGGRYRS